jgi:dTDP-glucose pyrophosphorylase
MLGIVPAAGRGSRIHLGTGMLGDAQSPRALADCVLDRLVRGGADRICCVIGSGQSEVREQFGTRFGPADLQYVVRAEPCGLCDALFSARALVGDDEPVVVGLPDTVWFPETALAGLPDGVLSLLLFPVEHPELFDAVALDERNQVVEIRVQQRNPGTDWIWGAFKMPGRVFHELDALWRARERRDEHVGSLVNAYIAAGGAALGCRAGQSYLDAGTLHGYIEAMLLLGDPARELSA